MAQFSKKYFSTGLIHSQVHKHGKLIWMHTLKLTPKCVNILSPLDFKRPVVQVFSERQYISFNKKGDIYISWPFRYYKSQNCFHLNISGFDNKVFFFLFDRESSILKTVKLKGTTYVFGLTFLSSRFGLRIFQQSTPLLENPVPWWKYAAFGSLLPWLPQQDPDLFCAYGTMMSEWKRSEKCLPSLVMVSRARWQD